VQQNIIPTCCSTMSYLRSRKPDAGLVQIFQAFPTIARPLLEYHEALLRGDSPFSAAERELIGAYVSGLNGCNHCRAVGWTDRALHYAAAICGLFNLMNRLADGLGVEAPESYRKSRRKASPRPVTHSCLIWFPNGLHRRLKLRSDRSAGGVLSSGLTKSWTLPFWLTFAVFFAIADAVRWEYFERKEAHLSGKPNPLIW
jgi:AhpD family alkylhydroperoxidase